MCTGSVSTSYVSRRIPRKWISEEETQLDNGKTLDGRRRSKFVPTDMSEWAKSQDRDAGDDEVDFHNDSKNGFVPDTKLAKWEFTRGKFLCIKTASPDSLINALFETTTDHRMNPTVALEILKRMEYLSTTLSVKQIRLFLEGFAGVMDKADDIVEIDEELMRTVHALGNEILCRFHSLTLFSCCSILTSLASLSCRDAGTLNVISIAFQRLVGPSVSPSLADVKIVEYCVNVIEAFDKLGYRLPGVSRSVVEAVKIRPIGLTDRIRIIHALHPDTDNELREGLFSGIDLDSLRSATIDQLLVLVTSPDLNQNVLRLLEKRIRMTRDTAVFLEKAGVDDDGFAVTREVILNEIQIKGLLEVVDEKFQHRDALVRIFH